MLMNSCQRELKALTPDVFLSKTSQVVFLQPPFVVFFSPMSGDFSGNPKVSCLDVDVFRMR